MASSDHDRLENNQHYFKEINYDEIQKLDTLGEGSFGIVHRAIWNNKFVAVKTITRDARADEKNAFDVEVKQLSRVNHQNIVKFYGACTKGPHIFLVLEYAEGGSLFHVLHCSPKVQYSLAHAMSWVYQCAKGVEYLHSMKPKPLIHRDLKPPNLLLIDRGTHLKICDFGTAADKSTYMTNSKGSAAWMAPEVFTSSNYTEKCDVFSWGIIIWEVISRRKPFYQIGGTAFTIMWAVYKGTRPPLLRNCPKCIEDLMCQCWDNIPSNRPSMSKIVEIMSKICYLLPGADQPLTTSDNGYYPEEDVYTDEENTYNSSQYNANSLNQFDPFPASNNNNVVKQLPQPTLEQSQPLHLITGPDDSHAWIDIGPVDLFNSNYIKAMHGFDIMVPNYDGYDEKCPEIGIIDRQILPSSGSSSILRADLHNVNTHSSGTSVHPDDTNLDSMYLLLDEHLRPVSPILSDQQSVSLFEEHKQLAQEYLKVQTEIALLAQRKNDLLTAQSIEQQRRQENLKQLQSEKESLKFIKQLLQQRETWVMVPKPGGT